WVNVAIAVALVAFGACVLLVSLVLTPKKDWEFYQDLQPYLSDIKAGDIVTPEDATYNLAKDSEASWWKNEPKLQDLHHKFRFACLLLAVQVIAWGLVVI